MVRYEDQEIVEEEEEKKEKSLFDEEEEEPETPEERLDWLLERRRKVMTEIDAIRPKEGDSVYKLKVDIFGTGEADMFGNRDTGLKGDVDDEMLRDPTLSKLTISRKYEMLMSQMTRYIIAAENRLKTLEKYIKEYNSNWAETLQMCLDFDEKKGEFVKEEMKRFIKEYEVEIIKRITKDRTIELMRMYDEADFVMFKKLVNPMGSPLKPSERVFLRAYNCIKEKFRDGESGG